jgi:hypothetical protein
MGTNKNLFPVMGACNPIQFSVSLLTRPVGLNPAIAKSKLIKRNPSDIKAIRNPAYKYLIP